MRRPGFGAGLALAGLILGGCGREAGANGVAPDGEVTRGGDGGRTIEVTSLADDGPGSLRAALAQPGARRILFKVGGEIWLKTPITIREPFVTVAGETAPSPGVSLMGDGLRIRGHDVIVRHLRVRIGALPGGNVGNRDGIGVDGSMDGTRPAYNILVDHCSVAWAIDEGVAIYGPGTHDVVVRNSIVAEGLRRSIHPKGPHSMGLLVGPRTQNVVVQGNLLASNRLRNPVVSAGASAIVVNNLIHNPGGAGLHFYSRRNPDPIRVTAVGNVLQAGPDTKPRLPAFQQGLAAGTRIHYRDNSARGALAFDRSEAVPTGEPSPFAGTSPIWRDGLNPLPAAKVRDAVLRGAGARPWDRDSVDSRIVREVLAGAGAIVDEPGDPRLRASAEATARAGELHRAKRARARQARRDRMAAGCEVDAGEC